MSNVLATQSDYRSLSIKDLLHARDIYHYHLINKQNVIGTAIGLYLIRDSDPQPSSRPTARPGGKPPPRRDKSPRTFFNSSVRDYSWPCLLVVVREWKKASDFGRAIRPEEMVPRTLYLPDGRMAPVCVVEAEPAAPQPSQVPDWHWPDSLYGGGMPLIVETQKLGRRATVGCLVTDGHTTYALTSRHVCGSLSEQVFAMAGGRKVAIGKASPTHLTRLPFNEVYPNYSGQRTYVNLDVGLIEVDDIRDWTSQIFGLGEIGPIADLNDLSLTLRLIDAPVAAYGAASGRLDGQIKGLFYRYKSVGAYDYVADFLIFPREPAAGAGGRGPKAGAQTQPGDSGAVWHLVTSEQDGAAGGGPPEANDKAGRTTEVLRPLAIEWGGQVLAEGAGSARRALALATSLTTVCRQLDVEIVRNHNTGVQPYWGQTGHYSIATFACQALPAGKLKTFMNDNLDRISFSISELKATDITDLIKAAREENDGFVPLADVPDIIWRQSGGRSSDNPTHYADIDEPRHSDQKTLLQLCLEDPKNISVPFWQDFYKDNKHFSSRSRGLLPFRVWQFFDSMKDFAAHGKAAEFLCAAGILAHYVGDACQPLHGSKYSDGIQFPKNADGTTPPTRGKGVHSTYESKMIDRHSSEIVAGIPGSLSSMGALPSISSGKKAAEAIIHLMDRSARRIPPRELVEAFVDAGGTTRVAEQDALWDRFGPDTIEVMADGARVLARIWRGAWAAGNGKAISDNKLGKIGHRRLMDCYQDPTFVQSFDLDDIGPHLEG